MTDKEECDLHRELCDKLNSVYILKNHDYGNSFHETFKEFGLVSAIVRISDKFNRLKALSKSFGLVKDETIQDTLLDLANYCVLTYIELEKENTEEDADRSC